MAYKGALARPVICPESALSGLSADKLRAFHERNFTAPRIVLAAAGMPHSALTQLADDMVGKLPGAPPAPTPASTYVGGDFRCALCCMSREGRRGRNIACAAVPACDNSPHRAWCMQLLITFQWLLGHRQAAWRLPCSAISADTSQRIFVFCVTEPIGWTIVAGPAVPVCGGQEA